MEVCELGAEDEGGGGMENLILERRVSEVEKRNLAKHTQLHIQYKNHTKFHTCLLIVSNREFDDKEFEC